MTAPAPDGGYGWVVLVASFVGHSLQYGIAWTVGVFYQIFIEQFRGGSAAIALTSSLLTATFYSAGAVGGILTNRFGYRTVAVGGSFVGSCGLILTMYATQVWHIYITFGVLAGVGYGLAYLPTVTVVAQYFDKKRNLAMGIAVSGVGVGTFVFPPFIRYLEEVYGWRGTLLILGGLGLNSCVCGALFRPVPEPGPQQVPDYTEKSPGIPHKKTESAQKRKADYKQLFNLEIFRNQSYLILCLNQILYSFGQSVVYVHLAYYASTTGLTVQQSAILISVIGSMNLVGRILVGLIAHHPSVNTVIFFIVCFLLTGMVTATVGLYRHVVLLMVYAASFGLLSAAWGTLLPEVIVRFLDSNPALLPSGYGYVLIFAGLGTLLGPPMAGLLYDQTRLYQMSFLMAGLCIVLSAIIMILPLHWQRRRAMQEYVTKEGVEQNLLVNTVAVT